MIFLIFSFVPSALLFSLSVCASAAGITLAFLYAPTDYTRALYIIASAAVLIAMFVIAATVAMGRIDALVKKLGETECDTTALACRLEKLRKRAHVGRAKAAVLHFLAEAYLSSGEYMKAIASASDAVIAGGERAKGKTAVINCKAYFYLRDKQYFDIFRDKAFAELDARGETENPELCRATDADRLTLAVMELLLGGDPVAAASRYDAFDRSRLTPLARKNSDRLKECITAAEESSDE